MNENGSFSIPSQDILNSSKIGIFILAPDFSVAWANSILQHYFGLRGDEIIGRDKRQLVHDRIQNVVDNSETFVKKLFATYDNNTYIENFECQVFPGCGCGGHWLEHWSKPLEDGPYAGGRIEYYYDITTRKQAEQHLQQTHAGLEQQVREQARRLTENSRKLHEETRKRKYVEQQNRQLYDLVTQQHHQLQALTNHLAKIQDSERKHLTQELHDQICQNLTALDFNLNIIRGQIVGHLSPSHTVQIYLDDSLTLLKQTGERIRNIMAWVSPPILNNKGLVAALHWHAGQLALRVPFCISIHAEHTLPRPAASTEQALFRITQEALTNVAKHAQATCVHITLEKKADRLRLTIADNGRGFEPKDLNDGNRQSGWGLMIMAERAKAVGGNCWIESQPDCGTNIIVEVSA